MEKSEVGTNHRKEKCIRRKSINKIAIRFTKFKLDVTFSSPLNNFEDEISLVSKKLKIEIHR
jgi:hypothetical protein